MLSSNYRKLIVAAFLLAFAANLGQTFFLSVFNQQLLAFSALSISELGNWYALATLVAGLSMHFSGSLIDHYSNSKMSLLVLSGISAGGLIMAFAPQGINLLLIYFLLRFFGQGMASHIAYTSISREQHPRRGMAISLVATAMPLGEAILPILSVFLLGFIGWQQFWLLLTVAAALLILVVAFIIPSMNTNIQQSDSNKIKNTSVSQQPQMKRAEVIRTIKFWLLVVATLFPAFAITALFFHQQIWLLAKQLELQQFATGLSLYAATHILGSLFSGWLVDKVGLSRMLKFYMLPIWFSVLALLVLSGESSLLAFMLLAGITVGASGPVTGTLWPTLYGSKHLGAIRGTITALMVISTAIAPALVGWLHSLAWSSEEVLLLLSGYGFLAAFVLLTIRLNPRAKVSL